MKPKWKQAKIEFDEAKGKWKASAVYICEAEGGREYPSVIWHEKKEFLEYFQSPILPYLID